MYVRFCYLHGKTIRTKCNLKVAFSLNSRIYNKKVIIQLIVLLNTEIYLDSSPDDFTVLVVIWALVQIYFGIVQSTV